jgi:hypothetical protein
MNLRSVRPMRACGAVLEPIFHDEHQEGRSMIIVSAMGHRFAGFLILFKAAYLVLLSSALLSWPRGEEQAIFYSTHHTQTPDGCLSFASHFVSSDAEYYLFLSQEGYEHGRLTCAFYPLYPLLIRWVSAFTGGHDILIGMILANVFSLVAFLLFFRMTARRHGEAAAALALAILLVFPGSLFFQFIYTESLFFLLLMLLLLGLAEDHCWLTLVAAFLLPLTRAVGILCVFPLLWYVFFMSPPAWWVSLVSLRGWAGRVARFFGPRSDDGRALNSPKWSGINAVCLVLAPVLGWATYFLLMWVWTGSAFEGIEAQKYYGVQSIHNLFDPVWFVTQLVNPTSWHAFRGSVLDRAVFILMVYSFPLIWRLDKSWCVWAFFLGVVPAMSGGFTSFTRFASVVFPLFIALGVLLSKQKMRWWRWSVLTTFVALHLILVWRYVNFGWAG